MVNKIAFYGPATSGKTWCADYLINHHSYHKVSFAGKLKDIAADLFNVHGKGGEDRALLQNLGYAMRTIRPSVWIDYLLKLANIYEKNYTNSLVLDDLRYTNEADALREAGWTLVMVFAPAQVREERRARLYPDTPASAYYHGSETEHVLIEPDYIVRSVDPIETAEEIEKILERISRGYQIAYGENNDVLTVESKTYAPIWTPSIQFASDPKKYRSCCPEGGCGCQE